MGIGGISIWQLAIILVIVLLLFGTKRLRGLGGDLGGAIKGFKKAMGEDEADKSKDGETDEQDEELKKVNTGEKTEAGQEQASKTQAK